MTNAEAIQEIKKPGRVFAQVLVTEDVIWVQQNKTEIVWILSQRPASDPAPWQLDWDDNNDLWLTA